MVKTDRCRCDPIRLAATAGFRVPGAQVNDAVLAVLGHHRNMQVTDVSNAVGVTDAGVRGLKACSRLEELRPGSTSVSATSRDAIKKLPSLRMDRAKSNRDLPDHALVGSKPRTNSSSHSSSNGQSTAHVPKSARCW